MGLGDDDRRQILLRRAAFISSTLAALGGCTTDRPSPEAPGSSPVISVPPGGEVRDDSGPPPAAAKPLHEQVAIPSLEIPSGVGAQARENFQRLFDAVKRIHPLLDAMDAIVPTCSILQPSCEDAWRQLAAKQNELSEIETFMYTCPGSSNDAKLYAAREREHQDVIDRRKRKLFERIQAALSSDADQGRTRWERLREDAYSTAPYPCLSIACSEW